MLFVAAFIAMLPAVTTTFMGGMDLSEEHVELFHMNLQGFCPVTQFCTLNASEPYELPLDTTRCCQPCSCDSSTCGLSRNCCYQEDDIYDIQNQDNTKCILNSLRSSDKQGISYYMTYNCLDRNISCEDFKSASWGSLNPVLDPQTKLIYLNKECASCNNVSEIVPFEPNVSCFIDSSKFPFVAYYTEDIDHLLNGIITQKRTCDLRFRAPKPEDMASQICPAEVIRKCHSLGPNKPVSQEVEELCRGFNATYLLNIGSDIFYFGNVFCALCNFPGLFRGPTSPFCAPVQGDVRNMHGFTITGLLKGHTYQSKKDRNYFERQICRKKETISQDAPQCRRLLCPECQLYHDGRCQLTVDFGGGATYIIVLKLTPVHQYRLIPVSLLETITPEQRDTATWLVRSELSSWQPLIFYHTTPSSDHVEYFVVKLVSSNKTSDLQSALQHVSSALRKEWTVYLSGIRFHFHVKINKHFSYTLYDIDAGVYGPHVGYPAELLQTYQSDQDEYVFRLSTDALLDLQLYNKALQFSPSYFCDQVDLHPSEYILVSGRVYLKEEDFFLEPIEYRIVTNNLGTQVIRVCTEVWHGHSNGAGHVGYLICMILVLSSYILQY